MILALILLHFCGGAQALHLPIRGLPQRGRPPDSLPGAGRGLAVAWGCAFCPSTGAGCGLAAALGCESLGQTAAPPLRAVEHKHNCTSLFTRGERLQQSAGLGRGRPSDSSTGAGRDLAAALGWQLRGSCSERVEAHQRRSEIRAPFAVRQSRQSAHADLHNLGLRIAYV